jgi:hypothetical protein
VPALNVIAISQGIRRMSVAIAQPIAGVSANRETEIEVVYPSVAAGGLGQLIGSIMGIPAGISFTPLRVMLYVILGSVMLPLGILAYALSKLFGSCYVLTNRSVKARKIIGSQQFAQVSLGEIERIEITQQGGYAFHRVGDLKLENASGNVLMVIPAISFPERLRQVILDARNARQESDQSLARIQARKS